MILTQEETEIRALLTFKGTKADLSKEESKRLQELNEKFYADEEPKSEYEFLKKHYVRILKAQGVLMLDNETVLMQEKFDEILGKADKWDALQLLIALNSNSACMRNDKIKAAIELIRNVYKSEGCEVGGIGHIVFDDGNIEDHHIDYCLSDASVKSWDLPEQSLAACKEALIYLKGLTYEERNDAVNGF